MKSIHDYWILESAYRQKNVRFTGSTYYWIKNWSWHWCWWDRLLLNPIKWLLNLINYRSWHWWDHLLLNPIKWLLNKWFMKKIIWTNKIIVQMITEQNDFENDYWTIIFENLYYRTKRLLKKWLLSNGLLNKNDYWAMDYWKVQDYWMNY
jgi:hypothetical protein